MSTIDHEKKYLHDSVEIIAEQDSFQLVAELLRCLYERRELCRAARKNHMREYSVLLLESHNDRIKKLLRL